MLKELTYKTLLITGLLPATFLLFFSLLALFNILNLDYLNQKHTLFLLSILLGTSGYIGLLTSLIYPKKTLLNFIFLLLGLIGFSIFLSHDGGMRGWIWLVSIEEPDEWIIIAWPIIVSIIGLIINLVRTIKHHPHSLE